MVTLRVRAVFDVPVEAVWDELQQIERHTMWMADAVRITFLGDRRRGVGARFVCTTRVGPIRLDDEMEVLLWDPLEAMGIRHHGVVTGEGSFRLRAAHERSTEMTWEEDLRFPWWLAGPFGARVARPVLARIWAGNLHRLGTILRGRAPEGIGPPQQPRTIGAFRAGRSRTR